MSRRSARRSEWPGRAEAEDARDARDARDALGDVKRRADAEDALEALGDANRRAIVQILGAGGRSVQEIADELPISRPAVSRHLRLLKDAGLVADRPSGTRNIYELRGEGVEAIRAYFAAVWDNAATRFRIVAENARDE